MVNILNDVSSVEELIQKNNKIWLYGAGASCKLLLMSYWDNVLSGHVEGIVDKNERLNGTYINVCSDKVLVSDIDSFASRIGDYQSETVLLLTPMFSSLIVEYLDGLDKLDGIKIYLLPMICRNHKPEEFPFRSTSEPVIPKKIHYFWIGNNPLPDEYKRNIDGWKKLNPDYEIICWNEDNYDFTAIPYMKEAYEAGGNYLMYATDYARMDILYRYGGIYFDTDVEMHRPLDDLLYNKAFIGIEENSQVNSGSGIGAVPGHPMIRKFMDSFEGRRFLDANGNPQRTFNTFYETKCLIENGFKTLNEYQIVNDMVCFPREVFMPTCFAGMEDFFTDRTVADHKINPEHHVKHKKAYNNFKSRIG